MTTDTPLQHAFVAAFKAQFAGRALDVAESQLAMAIDSVAARWEQIVIDLKAEG